MNNMQPSAQGIKPTIREHAAFLAMLTDFEQNDPSNAEAYADAREGFDAYVQFLHGQENGLNLPAGWVPCSHRWLRSPEGHIVGCTRLRHRIDNPFLFNEGGHIGCDISPSFRRKGLGHLALSVALAEAHTKEIGRVLLVTGETNLASRAVIGRQGGVLESIEYSAFWQERLCRYRIDVSCRSPCYHPEPTAK